MDSFSQYRNQNSDRDDGSESDSLDFIDCSIRQPVTEDILINSTDSESSIVFQRRKITNRAIILDDDDDAENVVEDGDKDVESINENSCDNSFKPSEESLSSGSSSVNNSINESNCSEYNHSNEVRGEELDNDEVTKSEAEDIKKAIINSLLEHTPSKINKENSTHNVTILENSRSSEKRESPDLVNCSASTLHDTASSGSDEVEEVTGLMNNVHMDLPTVSDYDQQDNLLAERERLAYEIRKIEKSIHDKNKMLNLVNINSLPDKGFRVKTVILKEEEALKKLNVQLIRVLGILDTLKISQPPRSSPKVSSSLLENSRVKITKQEDKHDPTVARMPKFGYLPSANVQEMGKKALETHILEQSLTVDALRKLHSSLKNCPSESNTISDPKGLKVSLLQHQKEALSWLMWRETQKPLGGILADDMGLGKTLEMISLILKSKQMKGEEEEESSSDENDPEERDDTRTYKGGTLIVCPASIVGQWEAEIIDKVQRGLLKVCIHHGQQREKKARRLAKLDVVITSVTIVRVESGNDRKGSKPKGALFNVKWDRVIVDEAHIIRNYKCQTSVAVCQLRAKRRWALTGTPVHNKEEDFFSLLKFIRCSPFDDIGVWKKWVGSKDASCLQRLNTLTKALMLRRTKEILISQGKLQSLPERSVECINITLNTDEQRLYEEVLNFSKTLMSQFLSQKAEKDNLLKFGVDVNRNKKKETEQENPFKDHPILDKMWQKLQTMDNVKTHEILVLFLRLRQICNHPYLMKGMVEKEVMLQDGIEDDDGMDMDLLERMSAMNVNDGSGPQTNETKTSSSSVFNLQNPVFQPDRPSSKIKAILNILEGKVLTEDKVVIVSQWTSMLDLVHDALLKKGLQCCMLTGKVPIEERTQMVEKFNKESKPKIMLLSLTAGGTGLNLVGGNNLIMIDPHWNPQLESQACDRIYRFGQKKPVKIIRIICSETIEERIQVLQQRKLELANSVLTGARNVQAAKLTLDDLKMLFNIS